MPKAPPTNASITVRPGPPEARALRLMRSLTPLDVPRAVADRLLYRHRQETDDDIDALVARLGGDHAVPEVMIGLADVRKLSIDPRLAFLLSRIDGVLTLREVRDLGPLDGDEVVRGLWALLHLGAIRTQPPTHW